MPSNPPDYEEIARVMSALSKAGFEPVVIGGIALAVLGSTRATRDCDYALEKTERAFREATRALFAAGYGMIFKWDDEKHEPLPDGVSTEDTAVSWAAIDQPESLWFWHSEKRIRIDLVFDLPMPIEELLARADRISIRGQRILVASPKDLLLMKEVSVKARTNRFKRLSDEQDIVFLRGILEDESERD